MERGMWQCGDGKEGREGKGTERERERGKGKEDGERGKYRGE